MTNRTLTTHRRHIRRTEKRTEGTDRERHRWNRQRRTDGTDREKDRRNRKRKGQTEQTEKRTDGTDKEKDRRNRQRKGQTELTENGRNRNTQFRIVVRHVEEDIREINKSSSRLTVMSCWVNTKFRTITLQMNKHFITGTQYINAPRDTYRFRNILTIGIRCVLWEW